MNRCALARLGLGVLLALLLAGESFADERVAWVRHAAPTAQPVDGGMGETAFAGRYLVGMEVVEAESDALAEPPRTVAPDFFVSTDPAYDSTGEWLYFAAKATADAPFQIWRAHGDAAPPKLVFRAASDCVQPVALPGEAVAFASLASGEFEEHGGALALSLWTWRPGDRGPTRLSYSPSSEFEPTILPDGRLLFASWQHAGASWPRGNVALLVLNSDGTGVFPYHGNHRGPWLKRGVVATGGEWFLHIQAGQFEGVGAGTLVRTNRNDSFAEARIVGALEGYEVADVAVAGPDRWLVSARPGGGGDRFGLYYVRDGALAPARVLDGEDSLAPAVSSRGFEPDLRFSTVVPGTEYAYLLVLDVYDSDRMARPGSAAPPYPLVRVIEGLPTTEWDGSAQFRHVERRPEEPLLAKSSATGRVRSRILGEVPPAPDGSVYLKVPADRPLRIQLIDSEGFAAMDERAWFWLRPNERRVCIGCHEGRELTPVNRIALAAGREPVDLTDPSAWEEVSFLQSVRPILRQSCAVASCHRSPNPTAAMNLSAIPCTDDTEPEMSEFYEPAYANLLARQPGKPFGVGGRRVHVGDARSSPLLWMLYGRALAPQYEAAPFERPMLAPHPGPRLPEEEIALIRKWIDLGAVYGSTASPTPGSASRLSKREDRR